MEEGSIAVLVDAKEEYTKQLISVLKACIYQGLKSIYNDAKDICNQDNTPEKVLMVFQDLLSRIPKWSQEVINKEFERIVDNSKCDYIEDLLKVIYVSHIKVLTIVHSTQKNKKLSLKVPNGGHFIHLCYIECAREFWKDPYLFSENVNKYELQKNMRDSENMISECITETIRKQLPVRHILKEFLNEPDEDIEEAEEDVREPVNKKYMKKLETVVKKELKTNTKSSSANGVVYGSNGGGEIDIDLIRRVIREELNTRPETDVIKKELVDTVVDKIVAAEKEQHPESKESNIVEPLLEGGGNAKSESDNKNDPNESESILEVPVIIPDTKTPIETVVEPIKVTKQADIVEQAEDTDSSSLEDLLEEIPFKNVNDNATKKTTGKGANSDNKLEQDDIVLDTPEPTIAPKISTDNLGRSDRGTEGSLPTTPSKAVAFSNIDEINLDLELDEDREEINLSDNELEEVDIKTTKSGSSSGNGKEIKNTKDTKYIFFNE